MGYVPAMFWIAALCLSLLAAGAFVVPLLHAPAAHGAEAERNALKAGLREAERDRARGLIGTHEFELARAEIARRLFRLEDAGERGFGSSRASKAVLFASAALVPVAAVALYWSLGSPAYADRPFAARADMPVLVARAEAHLRRNPTDARGWLAIAPALRAMNRPAEAATAFEKALEHGTYDASRRSALLTELAELRMLPARGQVAPVRSLLDEALALDDANQKAAYYLALGIEQGGDREAGARAWAGLLSRYPEADGAWVAVARRKVAALEAPLGPTIERAASIAALPSDGRRDMIDGMVAGLAARLEAEPNDPVGWPRLVRSLAVLRRTEEAKAALAKARTHLRDDAAAMSTLDGVAREFSL